ncbi:MAG: carboxylating nicotinate-nucleotide diphosphorylase [Ignavibacteriales bacterium]|nr:carboxylating nicotinate-nucleotide diphosphorylase [Ignavibacteriales bacterium]
MDFFDSRISRVIEQALFEDIGLGDVTTDAIISEEVQGIAEILIKENGVLSGLDVAECVFKTVDDELIFKKIFSDGDIVSKRIVAATMEGSLANILKAERTALNFLQRMSGIATLTRKFVKAVEGTNAKITDTRKTVPTLRFFDKLAVRDGGGVNHRFGLDDMVLIKDNHITAAGGIAIAIERCLKSLESQNAKLKIEVETKNLEEVREALLFAIVIDRIMLDNFSIPMTEEAVTLINRNVEVEASGNVSLENVRAIANTGVDFISIGALTHSPKALDISLDVSSKK